MSSILLQTTFKTTFEWFKAFPKEIARKLIIYYTTNSRSN